MSLPNSQIDRQALEQLQESHPELESVHQITALKEEEFIQTYARAFAGDVQQARRVYQLAKELQQHTALLWANLKDIASPFIQNTTFNTIPASFLEHQQAIPGYDRLFGNLDYVDCEPCRSVFGSAAYFVDLMRFVETFITERNRGIPVEHQLEHRRPDLFNLKLDCANTSDLIAYIDLVNETLETIVATSAKPDAAQVLNDAKFPSNLPYNRPLEEIRSYLSQVKLRLSEVYQTFETSPPSKVTAISRESLNLSPEEFEIIRAELITSVDLRECYGLNETQTLASLTTVSTFLEKTGLSRQELNDLLFQNLDQYEAHQLRLPRLFFINQAEDGLDSLQIKEGEREPNSFYRVPQEQLVNLSSAKLDRIYRFVKLARKLGWSFADLDWALRSLQSNSAPERGLYFDGINDDVTVQTGTKLDLPSFTIEAWIQPIRSKPNPILYKGENLTVDVPRIHFLFGLDADNQLVLHTQQYNISGTTAISIGRFTHVAVSISESQVLMYINGKPEPLTEANITPVTPVGTTLNIGSDLGYEFFAGSIKEVRIWQGVRSEATIAANRYRRFTGQERELAAYWTLIEEASNQVSDRTPNPNHGIWGGVGATTQPIWIPQDLLLDPLPLALEEAAFELNGVDQYLGTENIRGLQIDASTGNELTLEAWIMPRLNQTNPILRIGSGNFRRDSRRQPQFELGLTPEGTLAIAIGTTVIRAGNPAIALNQFTHVAVTISTRQIQFYVNGQAATPISLSTPLTVNGTELEIGRNLSNNYFAGQIREVRLWNQVRTSEQIQQTMNQVLPPLAAGLIGYWRFNQAAETAQDSSFNQNHLFLGGIPEEFMPNRITLPADSGFLHYPFLPVVTTGTVLEMDGTNDVMVISNPQNAGLGQYRQLTLELWFRPTNLEQRSAQRQVIYSQGDRKAGLSAYVFENQLYVVTWCEDDRQEIQETVLRSAPLVGSPQLEEQWHHLAITHDETRSLNWVEFRSYLDAVPLEFVASSHANNATLSDEQRGYPLSPTEFAYLGGIAEPGMTRFQGEFSTRSQHNFAGQITDLRLWKRVKTAAEIEAERYAAPELTHPDLVAYLPMSEGNGEVIRDRTQSGYEGTLTRRNQVFIADSADTRFNTLNSYYHPANGNALSWTNYVYMGRIYLSGQLNGPIGVTFYSQRVANVDSPELTPETIRRERDYRLQWQQNGNDSAFQLINYPNNQPIPLATPNLTLAVTTLDRWYRFHIEVENNAAQNRTDIRAKVWLEGTPEPEEFQWIAMDDSSDRPIAGTVGIWTASNPGTKWFDDLQVISLPTSTTPATVLLNENFESDAPDQIPVDWVNVGDRTNLFRPLQLEGQTVFGTDASLDNLSAIYTPPNAATTVMPLSNYTVTGRMRLSDAQGGIGITVLDHASAGVRQSYSLRRAPDSSFRLVADIESVLSELSRSPRSTTDSRIVPLANTWYAFRLVVEDRPTENRTHLRAKVWQDGTAEPDNFQMEAFDSRENRLRSGGVGVWTTGTGAKYFDSFQVFPLNENFGRYQDNGNPSNWQSTASGYSRNVDANLFKTSVQNDNIIFRTTSGAADIHSHYATSDSLKWSNYIYSGRLSFTQPDASLGVTFFSRYPDTQATENAFDRYYRLERVSTGSSGSVQFQLIARRNGVSTIPLQGTLSTIVTLPPNTTSHNTWYRFQIEVRDTGSRTQIRAKVWVSGTPEPRDDQMNAFDDASDRLKAGTVGLWSRGNGEKRFDDLQVQWIESLTASPLVNDWQSSIRQSELANGLFRTADAQDNTARWSTDHPYPLLLRPLDRQALEFGQNRRYLAINNPTGLNFNQFTIATWALWALGNRFVDRPIFSWRNQTTGESFWFGVTRVGRLTLVRVGADNLVEQVESVAALGNGQFAYLAVTVNEGIVTFYIDGEPDPPIPFPSAISFNPDSLEVGRFAGNFFTEFMLDLRLWSTAFSPAQFAPDLRYQMPDSTAADLAGYWAFNEPDGGLAFDSSVNANHLRLGGVEGVRRPDFVGTPSLSPTIQRSSVTLDTSTLTQIATIRQLQERHNHLAIDRLAALWFQIRHTGSEDGQTLFDRVFNGRGITGETWDYAQSPLRWDSAGENRQDREIRSRLMGSLQISSEDLDRLARWISNTTPVIELDSQNLNHLYRLSQIPKVLRLNVQDFLRLLNLIQLTDVNTLEDFKQVSDRADWLQRTGIQVSELEFLTGSTSSSSIPRPYTNAAIRDLATALTNQSSEFLATSSSFVSDLVNLTQSMQIFESLRSAGIVDELGSVSVQYQPPVNLQDVSSLPADSAVRQAIQTQIEDTLSQMQQEHANAVVERLAELFQVEPERLRIVDDHLNVTPSMFLNWMQQVVDATDRQEFPTDLTNSLIPYLDQLTKGLYLITRFALTTAEATDLLQNPDHFSVTNVFEPAIADLEHLVMFTELKTAFNDVNGGLIRVFNQATDLTISEAILDVTNWDSIQLTTLTHYFENRSAANRIPELHRLYRAFVLTETLQVDVEFFIQLANTDNLNLEFYHQQSNALLNVVRSRYDDEQWQRVYKPLRDRLATQQRDALLSNALSRQLPVTFQGRRDADVLYEYLLLDVQIGSEVETSRIVQGTAALQLYVQRCLLNLEQGVNPATIPLDQWNWMKNYRVWEANRKVFLYPESYIEPELRDTKTPQFEALEQELMQGEINQTNVERVFNNYLNKLAELADLKIVGSYLHKEPGILFRESLAISAALNLAVIPSALRLAFSSNGIVLPASPSVRVLQEGNLWEMNAAESYLIRSIAGVGLNVETLNINGRTLFSFVDRRNDLLTGLDAHAPISSELLEIFARRGVVLSANPADLRVEGQFPQWMLTDRDQTYLLRTNDNELVVSSRENRDETLYLIGRTTTQPRTYYYRERSNGIQWLPWKQIDLTLSADFVTPVYAFNRLFLFWVEFTAVSRPNLDAAPNRTVYQPVVMYAYLDLNGVWSTPQIYNQVDRELEEPERSRPEWQRVYALRSFFEISSSGTGDQFSAERRERLLVIYGDTNHAPIPVRTLRNAREQETFTLQFTPQHSTTNTLNVELSPQYLGQMQQRLGYLSLSQNGANITLLNNAAVNDASGDSAREGLRSLLNQLFVDSSDDSEPLNLPSVQVEAQGNDQWLITENGNDAGETRLVVRREGDRLNVYQPSWFLGFLTTHFVSLLDGIAEGRADNNQRQQLRNILRILFGRPQGIPEVNVPEPFQVQKQGINQWFLTYDDRRLLIRQAGARLNVYRFSDRFLRATLNRLAGDDILGDLQLTDQGNNRWLVTPAGRNPAFLLVPEGQNILNAYRFSNSSLQFTTSTGVSDFNEYTLALAPESPPIPGQPLFNALPLESSLLSVNNQPGWYILETGEEQFLLQSTVSEVATDAERLVFPFTNDNSRTLFTFTADAALRDSQQFQSERLDTTAIRELILTMFREGTDGLLSLRSQQTQERNFAIYQPTGALTTSPPVQIDFSGAFGAYYWEIFFHIPFFIANQFNANQDFAGAQRWYHYIFNPTTQEPAASTFNRYWQYLPFRNLTLESLSAILSNQAALAEYRHDPFDPHAIARLRVNAYQKAIVMKYIDNLLDWGDYLFNQNNRESIGEAAQLYVLAHNLLGPRPEGRANRRFEDIGDYNTIRQVFDTPPDFLTEFSRNGALPIPQNGNILTTFCVTENAEFVSFWDRVSDRLFKIRHSLNIDGVFRQLDLFQPALDVRALVTAFASGNRDLSSILADVNRPVPHYRYGYMLDKAKEMTEIVISLGEKLLEAIQNRDAEQLATLQNTHERNILDLTIATREAELEVVRQEIEALQLSRQSIQNRQAYYEMLLAGSRNFTGFSPLSLIEEEGLGLDLTTGSISAQAAQAIAKGIGSAAGAFSKENPVKDIFDLAGDALGAAGGVLATSATLLATIATYKRRRAEWQQEQNAIAFELQEIDQQIVVANIRLRMAEHELTVHNRTIQQNQEIADFYRRKFTNEQLYNWMISRISGLYFQAYKLAYATAKDAERAFQYEFGDNGQFINFGHWDSLRRGLLAGESLQLDLMRLEKYAIDQDSRYQEIEKVISLRTALPEAFAMLRNNGSCFFTLTERMFDVDYPGHFFRIIKSIAISVQSPALTPNQSLNATLIQLNNRTLLEPDIEAVRYLMGVEGINQPDATVVRSNWRANQQIAVSRPNRDNGMFGDFDSLLLFDDRYFPFEGTGAVSSWELEIPQAPQFLSANDSDIIIHLKYTSRSDRGAFRRAVQEEVRRGGF